MINKDNTCDYGTIKGGTQNILEMIFLKKKKKKDERCNMYPNKSRYNNNMYQ